MITIDQIKTYGIVKVMEAEGYLTVKETAIRCNMTEAAVRQAISRCRFSDLVRVGNDWYIAKTDEPTRKNNRTINTFKRKKEIKA